MLYVSTKFNYTSQVEYKLQQSTIQVTIEHNTSYNRAQYRLQQSTIQVTIQHNTSYNRAQYKLQYSTIQVTIQHNTSFLYLYRNPLNPEFNPICYLLALLAHHFLHVSRIRVNGGAQIVCRSPLDTYYNGEQLIEQPRSKCLWGLLHVRHVILRSCEQRHLLRKHHTTYCNDTSTAKTIHRYHLLKCVYIFLADSLLAKMGSG